MPGSPTYVRYTNPAFTHVTLDLLLEWIALAKPRVGAYGLLGLASSTERWRPAVAGLSPASLARWA